MSRQNPPLAEQRQAGTPETITQFEQNLEELERIVQRMEQGDLRLEQALQDYERGILLARQCTEALNAAETRINALAQEPHGADEDRP
ncbi:exodeoxyribonuclease VII small subunit [Halothiobacillus sp. DCM-1]|uniref:exodeoxyribonuclease VII small subunit n=1 Tax=Halothiobacillus sp. DCM-1 TaxID=3112558 RepID=UPI00324B6386